MGHAGGCPSRERARYGAGARRIGCVLFPCLSFPTAPKRHSESKREAGAGRSGTGFFASLWKSQAAIGASAGFAALRRFRKTYPPMPVSRSSEATTWPGSGTAAEPPLPVKKSEALIDGVPEPPPEVFTKPTRMEFADVALPRGCCGSTFREKMVGTPRRRGRKFQARTRRFWMQRRHCRARILYFSRASSMSSSSPGNR